MRPIRLLLPLCALLIAAQCDVCNPPPPPPPSSGGDGVIRMGGRDVAYVLVPEESRLLLLNKKITTRGDCNFFHHHAVAALTTDHDFTLDRDNPQNGTLSATVHTDGLDPDRPEYRDAFEETRGSTFSERDREDIRTNMLEQLDASNFPIITFTARNLSTLEGSGTAEVTVDLKGKQSVTTMNASARWDGDKLIMEGTALLDGAQHDIPVGTFRDCIDPQMTLLMTITLKPGQGGGNLFPDGGDPGPVDAARQFYEPEGECAEMGYEDVRQTLLVRCAGCHNNPPTVGARDPLVTWEDYHWQARLPPPQPMYLAVAERIVDAGFRKMPPEGSTDITGAERAQVLQWIAAGAHPYKCDGNGNPIIPPPPDAGPIPTPPECGDVGYQVARDLVNRYCVPCHVEGGGQVPLDTHEAGLTPSTHPAYPSMTRWRSSYLRMLDQSMPPGSVVPTSGEMELMRRFVAAGAPRYACDADGGVLPDTDAGPPPTTCGTGSYWPTNEHRVTGRSAAEMHPGRNCIECHLEMERAPDDFVVAGTVMRTFHDRDDCESNVPPSGVTVRITDANERIVDLTVNRNGNFYTRFPVQPPYRAEVRYGGRVRRMFTAQMDTNCMNCHTEQGEEGAPGRIVVP
ncbi:MAG: c-type cytochrome [Myxococcota bacterium]